MPDDEHAIMVQLAVACDASYLEEATYGAKAIAMLEELHKRGYEIVNKRPENNHE